MFENKLTGYRGVSWERGDVCFEGRHRGMWLFCVVTGSQQLTIWTSSGETSKSVPDVLFFLFDIGVGTFFITAESLFDYQFWVISNWHSTVRLCERIAFGVIPKPSRRVAGAVFLMLDHSGHSVSCRPARTVLSISELQKRNPYGFQTWPNLELETHYRQSHSRQSFAFVRGSWELCKTIGRTPGKGSVAQPTQGSPGSEDVPVRAKVQEHEVTALLSSGSAWCSSGFFDGGTTWPPSPPCDGWQCQKGARPQSSQTPVDAGWTLGRKAHELANSPCSFISRIYLSWKVVTQIGS